ncbi:isoprenylcysteine carboxyl methyltransferase family protein [Tumebacillus permanentifrigoris]|uniref:15-methylpalmitoyl-4-hydroxy-2-pyrone 4-O-methyltransferase n=1 Tax=Tumebacillus permanentifrigoris TaxID=378543 RepID=A0A316DAG8_9BACL|nr:isoprenylcysteine carboxylmethyltransferase family protein [Tumebacillus permanentifrigoris]PWK13377.1 15-methylpalmitoyl-4-hydroxy-2-pyrone 4-O-methyltransferase [Tumebacillus permanentifrigoris]
MVTFFEIVFALVIAQRLLELLIARRNAHYLRAIGGYEVGGDHYRWIVLLHATFFLSLFGEVVERGRLDQPPYLLPFAVFLIAQALRIWILRSLGKFWNTRIFVLPGSEPVRRGPYRFLKHPNYTVVALELFTLPLAFGAPLTAVLFSLLNIAVLRVRIRTEERALAEVTAYAEQMGDLPRFTPFRKP